MLRGIEEEGGKRRAAEIVVHAAPPVALYILNHKRERLTEIELRYGMRVAVAGDDDADGAAVPHRAAARPGCDRGAGDGHAGRVFRRRRPRWRRRLPATEEAEDEASEDAVRAVAGETAEEAEHRHRRRRRRRRGGRREEAPAVLATDEVPVGDGEEAEASGTPVEGVPEHAEAGEDEQHGAAARPLGAGCVVAVAVGGAVATTPTARCHRTQSLVRNSRNCRRFIPVLRPPIHLVDTHSISLTCLSRRRT